MIKSEIIADSINPKDIRLTTFIFEYPRLIHAELLTHRVFSKNAASSRAIPIEKFIQQVEDNPVIPRHWGKNQSGMQANEELDNITPIYDAYPVADVDGSVYVPCRLTARMKAQEIWLRARDANVGFVRELDAVGLHKQIANRCLEPWFHIRVILSGTEFENFFALRDHEAAHPDLQALAHLALEQYNASEPNSLSPGEWHIPFGDLIDERRLHVLTASAVDISEAKRKIAVARCARISYLNYEGKDDYAADIKLCDRLFGSSPKHLSPTEHVALSMDDVQPYGNFRGWKQFRKFFPDENLPDPRVIKKYYKVSA